MEEKAVGATAVGTVKWFDERKGYGFMVVADTEPVQQLFMHSYVLPRKRDACVPRPWVGWSVGARRK